MLTELQTPPRKVELVKAKILKQITDDRLRPGQRIPGENELTQRLSVSRTTIREAIGVLVHEGLLLRRRGSGTYLTEQTPAGRDAKKSVVRVGVVVFGQNLLHPIPYLSEIMQGLAEPETEHSNFRIDTTFLAADGGFADAGGVHFMEAVKNNRVDALLFTVVEHVQSDQLKWLEENGKTIIFCSTAYPQGKYPCVRSDLVAGVRRTVDRLHKRGHRRIGLLLERRRGRSAAAFMGGYVMARSALGLNCTEYHVAYTEGDRSRIGGAVNELLADDIDALICYDDEAAVDTIRQLQAKNVNVPNDVCVIGTNDTVAADAEDGIPPLTTLRLPLRDMGRASRDLILAAAEGKMIERRSIVFEPELILRASGMNDCARMEH